MYQRPRVMPVLLMGNAGLVKTQRFEKPKYLGDPINTVKIFNDKEVDELVLLDILSTSRGRPIQFDVIQEIVSEAFVPVTYGGGVRSVSDVSQAARARRREDLAQHRRDRRSEAARRYRRPFRVVDAGRVDRCRQASAPLRGRDVERHTRNGSRSGDLRVRGPAPRCRRDPHQQRRPRRHHGGLRHRVARAGLERGDGSDRRVRGARSVEDFRLAVSKGGVSACAAGAMFVFQGRHRAVLISFPSQEELDRGFGVPA